jgi:excisionase family DNA binding protein
MRDLKPLLVGDLIDLPSFPEQTAPDVLTTVEAARVLRCSKAHFCNLLNGKVPGLPALPHLRLGRRRLVRRATLSQWIEEVERLRRAG